MVGYSMSKNMDTTMALKAVDINVYLHVDSVKFRGVDFFSIVEYN